MGKLIKLSAALVLLVFTTAIYAQIEMRPRPTDEKDYPEYIQYLVDVSFSRTAEERAMDAEVQE